MMSLGLRLLIGISIMIVLLTIITLTVEDRILRSLLVGFSSFISMLTVNCIAKLKTTSKNKDHK
jgi:hypothetical protein